MDFSIAYIDNILFYCNFKKKNSTYMQKVVMALQKTKLQANINKY